MKLNGKPGIGIYGLILFSTAGLSSVVSGANYYFQSGKTDFSDLNSYLVDNAVPATLPTADDLVYLPSGETIEVDAPSTSFSSIASVNRIVSAGQGRLVVNVTNESDECEMSSAFAVGNAGNDYYKGRLVKRGPGTLKLTSSATVGGKSGYSYYTHIDVAGGVLKLPDHASGTRLYGQIAVSNGATLVTSIAAASQFCGLFGAGLITNASDSTSHAISIKCAWASSIRDGVDFSGAIGGRISLTSNGCGSLTGENSTFSGNMTANHVTETSAGGIATAKYILGVKKFGIANEPSSIGTNGVVQTGTRGGRFKYLGTGETTDKDFAVQQSQLNLGVPFEIDGGTTGGLVIEGGKITSPYAGAGSFIPRMLLTGSHANACVMAVPINAGSFSFHVKKTGSGRWEFLRAAKDSTNGGAFTIEEGELGYDSLAPARKQCSFGYATNLCEFVSDTKITDAIRIPYAFRLGSEGKMAALDYMGTNRVSGSERLTGLAGTGRFTTSGENCSEVYFDGVSAIGEGAERTLVLDGNLGTNTFANITNGEGVVSVVKRGVGAWVIEKETSFSGILSVEGGTLVVRAPDAPYSWHRLTIKSTWGEGFPSLFEFAMYDADGTRRNTGLVVDHVRNRANPANEFDVRITPKNNAMELAPGHATFSDGRTHKVGYASEDIDKIFDDKSNTYWMDYTLGSAGSYPVEGTSSTWLKITMRQNVDAGEIVAYDMVERKLVKTGATTYPIKKYVIEGSQNGVTWTTLTNATYGVWNEGTQTYDDPGSFSGKWYSTLTDFTANRVLGEGEGFALPGRPEWNGPAALANVSQVFVTSNAVLEAEGSVSIGSIVVDCASGGTINGFMLRPSGSLSLVNVPKINGGSYALPISFKGVSGLENLANWTLSIDGVVKVPGAAHVVANNGSAYLVRSGLLIIFN